MGQVFRWIKAYRWIFFSVCILAFQKLKMSLESEAMRTFFFLFLYVCGSFFPYLFIARHL